MQLGAQTEHFAACSRRERIGVLHVEVGALTHPDGVIDAAPVERAPVDDEVLIRRDLGEGATVDLKLAGQVHRAVAAVNRVVGAAVEVNVVVLA